jgi:hypothetical protein
MGYEIEQRDREKKINLPTIVKRKKEKKSYIIYLPHLSFLKIFSCPPRHNLIG